MQTVIISTITASHAFDERVGFAVHEQIGNARLWAQNELERLYADARRDDPSFDAYHFNVTEVRHDVQDT